MMKNIIYIVIATLLFSTNAYSQEIKAEVSVNMEQIEMEYRNDVSSLATDIERYINRTNFTSELGDDWEGEPIPISIQIMLSGGYNSNYIAQMYINSGRSIYGTKSGLSTALLLLEKTWSFKYKRGAMLSYSRRYYDDLTTMMNFYMLMCIGFDLDTYSELGGSRTYNLAYQVQQLGASKGAPGYDSYVDEGDYSKCGMIAELTSPKYEPFRALVTEYYMDGLDMMAEDKATATQNLELIIRDMAKFKRDKLYKNSAIMLSFFHAKSDELISIFKDYDSLNDLVWEDLMYLDPANTMKYEDARDGKLDR